MDWVSLYGAGLSTLTACAGVYAWITRNSVTVRCVPNMLETPNDGKEYIVCTVINRSSTAIQITHFHGVWYKNVFDRFFNKKRAKYFVVTENHIPKRLDVGDYWLFMANQKRIEEEYGESGILYMGVTHTFSDKPIFRRVSFKK